MFKTLATKSHALTLKNAVLADEMRPDIHAEKSFFG